MIDTLITGGFVVTATHAGFDEGTTYMATVTASDIADNLMTEPFSWSFTTLTEEYWIYLPLVLKQ
jgi:hypothetical protein